MSNKSTKQRLAEHGYSVQRVYWPDGSYRGVCILDPNGKQVNQPPTCCVDFGNELVDQLDLRNSLVLGPEHRAFFQRTEI